MGNVQVIKDAYDCFGRGDIPTLLGLMDPISSGARQRGIHTSSRIDSTRSNSATECP